MSTETATAPVSNASAGVSTPAQASTTSTQQTSSNAAGTAVASSWYKEFIREDGSLNHAALDKAPDHVKPIAETWKKAKNFDDLAVIHNNANGLLGKKLMAPLPPDAPDNVRAERKAHLDSLNGVPANPADYKLAKPESFPAEQWSQPLADNFAKWCHENSVSPAAAKKMIELQAQGVQAQIADNEKYGQQYRAKQQETFDATIRQENIPAERAATLVEKGVISLGLDPASPETQQLLKDSAAVRLMAMRHAISIGESPTVTANSSTTGAVDPAKEAQDIVSNPANPLHAAFWNKDGKFSRAAHDAAVEKRNQLLQLAEATNSKKR